MSRAFKIKAVVLAAFAVASVVLMGVILSSMQDKLSVDDCTSDIRYEMESLPGLLAAADEETDIIMGLDLGGDDYITKPFKLAVFLARVNALLRRGGNFQQENTGLESNGIRVDFLRQEVFKGQERIELTAGEYRLLCLFMENPDIVLSPEQILGRLWDREENYINSSTLTVYIRRLRAKIEDDPGVPEKIVTVRRMGYRWNTAGSAEKSSGAE